MDTQEQQSRTNGYPQIVTDYKSLGLDEQSIRTFAQNASKSHNWFHHFTNVESLVKIFSTKRWKLSSAYSCNDLQEYQQKGDIDERKYIFSVSLSHGDCDNIGMWKMYGGKKDKEKIRISFPLEALLDWVKSLTGDHCIYDAKNEIITSPNIQFIETFDIIYCYGFQNDNTSSLHWDGNERSLLNNGIVSNPSQYPELTGYLKNSGWEYEQETRLSIRLTNNVILPERLFIDIPDAVLGQIQIATSPFYSPIAVNDFLGKKISSTKGNSLSDCEIKNLIDRTRPSYFDGKLNL